MNEDLIAVRDAEYKDARVLWEWVNEPAVRAMSFTSDPIPWEDHLRWFSRKLMDPGCRLYIGTADDVGPVGQVRFDFEGAVATLSVSVDARFRGKGYGVPLIRQASRQLFRTTEVTEIEAFVKPANASSSSVFRKAGFSDTGMRTVAGQAAVRFVLERTKSHPAAR